MIIQGGMGIGVSNWNLARSVSTTGQLGVISGTALSTIFVRRLQNGDEDGSIRRALRHCPLQKTVEKLLDRYFLEGGRKAGQPYRLAPMYSLDSSDHLISLTIVANFVEVWLAKEDHTGIIGINLLEKVQLPTLASLYGAMLASVDYVLMGAGIPRAIPGVLDHFAVGLPTDLRVTVEGDTSENGHSVHFDPAQFMGSPAPVLRRPQFLAIVSSYTIANTLVRKASGRIDGIIVEATSAGGHNAPPRGKRNSTNAANRFMVRETSQISTRFAPSDCPFGWRVPAQAACKKRSISERQASKSARHSPSAMSQVSLLSSSERCSNAALQERSL